MANVVTVTYSTEDVRKLAHGNDVVIKARSQAEALARAQKRKLAGAWTVKVAAGVYTLTFPLA